MILAGGTGERVGADIPKQFIKVLNKPILAYTIDCFQNHPKIDAIEIVSHRNWISQVDAIVSGYDYSKVKWICAGGDTYQQSTINGVQNLNKILASGDILVSSFGVSPMTPADDISDAIRVAKLHGNGIAAEDISLCTCKINNQESSDTNVVRETLKGFSNPWAFEYSELLESYHYAIDNNMLDTLEPHTTSLYFALGKTIWFSQCTSPFSKITRKQDLDIFEGLLLLQQQRNLFVEEFK